LPCHRDTEYVGQQMHRLAGQASRPPRRCARLFRDLRERRGLPRCLVPMKLSRRKPVPITAQEATLQRGQLLYPNE
jgi:hypothetical protein